MRELVVSVGEIVDGFGLQLFLFLQKIDNYANRLPDDVYKDFFGMMTISLTMAVETLFVTTSCSILLRMMTKL